MSRAASSTELVPLPNSSIRIRLRRVVELTEKAAWRRSPAKACRVSRLRKQLERKSAACAALLDLFGLLAEGAHSRAIRGSDTRSLVDVRARSLSVRPMTTRLAGTLCSTASCSVLLSVDEDTPR